MKLRIAKTLFWFFAGLGLTVFLLRIIHGPGSVTALSDIIPWGLWKGGGVVALVAMGGAGFTLAMFSYVFRWKTCQPLVRGAVLLALLCYSSVALGLTIDIGIWWRIVFPMFHWQFHSVLFEVAWCIILYLGVLFFEFSHTAMEKFGWTRLLHAAHKTTLIFVITGISLSSLHQSSLGTLFLATPFRLHPLWHTDMLPLFFFLSSIAIGCLTISVVTIFVHWLYEAEPPMKAIAAVGKVSAYLMVVYLGLKLVEIVFAGEAGYLFQANWDTFNFWLEIVLSAVIPIIFLFQTKVRASKSQMFWVGLVAAAGICLNRVNVAGLATLSLTSADYLPSLTEWCVTLGVLSGAALAFLFGVEFFGLFEGISRERVQEHYAPGELDHTDWRALFFGSQRLGEVRLYSFFFVFAMALTFLFLSDNPVFGVSPESTPTSKPRLVGAVEVTSADGARTELILADSAQSSAHSARNVKVLMIDGNRDGRYVFFDHDKHVKKTEGRTAGCAICHHLNNPLEDASSCYGCHSDMYLEHDIFDHAYHVDKTGGNAHCTDCHLDPDLPKVRKNTKHCLECHKGMIAGESLITAENLKTLMRSSATGYMDAMHGLCVTCHEKVQEERGAKDDGFAACANCHRHFPDIESEAWDERR